MKIGIDARLYGNSGIGKYIANLIDQLELIDQKNKYIIFLNKDNESLYVPNNDNFKKWVFNVREYSLSEQINLYFELNRAGLDLMHFTGPNQPYFYNNKKITTIHDFTMLQYDEQSTTLPKYQYAIKHFGLRKVFDKAIRTSDYIITPSESVRKDLYHMYRKNDKQLIKLNRKSKVIYEGINLDLRNKIIDSQTLTKEFLTSLGINSDYILYVGNILPHKNLKDLIIAFKDLHEKKLFNGQLVIAGRLSKYSNQLAGFVRALKLEKNIIFPVVYKEEGLLTDSDIANLYKNADCYVMPSKSEGFSLTPLEAQSLGIPCLISDIDVHQEIYRDTVEFFKTDSVIDLTNKLYKIVISTQRRDLLIKKGYENVESYSFKLMAENTHDLYMKSIQTIK